MFPPEIAKTMDAEKEERKKRMGIIILIVVIFALLAGVVAIGAASVANGGFTVGGKKSQEVPKEQPMEEVTETVVAEEVAEIEEPEPQEAQEVAEEAEEVEEAKQDDEEIDPNRPIKDDNGRYYNYIAETDDAGNVIFNAVYPEDFDTVDFSVDYGKYSTKYPISMNFVVSGEDNSIRFLYMSPQQLWYKNSETGKSRSNEKDLSYYMSYYTYNGAEGYIEDMLAESYPKAKIELVNKIEPNETEEKAISELSKAKTKSLFKVTDDYAHIGSDTTYANMEAEYSACVYEYEITTTDKQIVFDKFYVPLIANNLYYASDSANDRGTVTEWYMLAFVAVEAGNEDLYDDYADDFDVFVANCVPTDTFMYINQLYGKEVTDAIDSLRSPDALTKELLDDYTKEAKKGIKLNDFNESVMKTLASFGGKTFSSDGTTIYGKPSDAVAFVSADKGKAFISGTEDEYPGSEYKELKVIE